MKKYTLIFLLFFNTCAYSQEMFELREEVYAYLAQSNSNFNFAMLAEAYRGETRIALFWPCLMDSVIIDNKILAVAFEKQNGKWESFDMFIASRDTAMTKFFQVLGGKDYNLVKPNGIAIENFGNFMYEGITRTHKALLKKENEKATREIEEFSRIFALNTCAFSNTMTDYIMRGAKTLDISEVKITDVKTVNNKGSAMLDVYFPKEAKSNKIQLVKIGSGWAIDSLESVR